MKRYGSEPGEQILLLIDGHCILCHGMTRFVMKRDTDKRFRFASLQSSAGQRIRAQVGLSADRLDTFVMVRGQRVYTKSEAALRVFRELGGLWRLLYGCIVIPVSIRNWVYDQIANRRYRWFGRTEACLLPTEELRSRWIEDTEEVPDHGHENQADLRGNKH